MHPELEKLSLAERKKLHLRRVRFEALMLQGYPCKDKESQELILMRDEQGDYDNSYISAMWYGWQMRSLEDDVQTETTNPAEGP